MSKTCGRSDEPLRKETHHITLSGSIDGIPRCPGCGRCCPTRSSYYSHWGQTHGGDPPMSYLDLVDGVEGEQ